MPTDLPWPRPPGRRRRSPIARFARAWRSALIAATIGFAGVSYLSSDPNGFLAGTLSEPAKSRPNVPDVIVTYGSPIRAPSARDRQTTAQTFGVCGSTRINCIVDGDTIWLSGVKIRMADYDTPEIGEPKCASEAALGHKAKIRLVEWMNAGPFDVVPSGGRDVDQYGRKLRVLTRDGRSVADLLIAEGLARRWDGARRSWC